MGERDTGYGLEPPAQPSARAARSRAQETGAESTSFGMTADERKKRRRDRERWADDETRRATLAPARALRLTLRWRPLPRLARQRPAPELQVDIAEASRNARLRDQAGALERPQQMARRGRQLGLETPAPTRLFG